MRDSKTPSRAVLVVVVGLATITGAVVPVAGAVAPVTGSGTADTGGAAATAQEEPLELNRSTVAFGEVAVGETARAGIGVRNEGDSAVTVSDVNIQSGDLRSFGVDTETVPDELAPGERAVVRVSFSPPSTGEQSLSLELVTEAGQSLPISLTGTGVQEATEEPSSGGNLTVEPSGLFFGEVAVGETGTSEVTVSNTGTAAVTVSEIRTGGRNGSMFSADTDSLTLDPGESETVTVTFAPTSGGAKAGDLLLTTDAGRTVEVGLVAAATGPSLSVDPASVAFGTVASGESATRTVTIRNDGDGPISVERLELRGADADQFSIRGDAGGSLGAGETRQVTVVFEPGATGQQRARLVVETDTDGLSATVQLQGATPAPEVVVDRRSLQFGEATVDERIVREITVSNEGEGRLRIDSASVAGPRDVFRLQQSTPITVAAGSERTLSVAFQPDAARSFSGTLRLSTNDPDEPTVPIWLTNTDTMVSMSVREEAGTTQADISVSNVSAGQNVSLTYGDPDTGENVSVTGVGATVERGGSFTVNVTASEEPQETTPEFDPAEENGTEPLNYLDIQHSISNENIRESQVRVRVRKERIDAMANTDPGEVQLYRYDEQQGEWVPQETTFRETDTHYVYVGRGDGFSEWATGAKRARFQVVQANVSVSTITAGDSVNINVRIENTGGADGDFLTELLLNEEVVESREVTVAAGGTAQVTFDRSFGQPGDYSIRVNQFDVGEVTVSQGQANATTTGGSGTDDAGSTGVFGPGFGVPAAVLALLAAALLARRRE